MSREHFQLMISDLPILILDDVWTTGSTLRELVLAIAKPERVSTLLVLSTAYQLGTKDVWKNGSA
jgi:predicted amidophosphoribosyltransferase